MIYIAFKVGSSISAKELVLNSVNRSANRSFVGARTVNGAVPLSVFTRLPSAYCILY